MGYGTGALWDCDMSLFGWPTQAKSPLLVQRGWVPDVQGDLPVYLGACWEIFISGQLMSQQWVWFNHVSSLTPGGVAVVFLTRSFQGDKQVIEKV